MAEILTKPFFNDGLSYFRDRSERDIKQNRMGDFTVLLTDENGVPVPGKTVRMKHKTHDFDFGCNFFMYKQYKTEEQNQFYEAEWKRLFNTAVVPLYWDGTEPEEGDLKYTADIADCIYRRPSAMRVVNWCKENGVRPKGHPLFWHEFIPQWVPENWEELYPLIEKRFKEISDLFADKISVFDCVNEPARLWDVHHDHLNDTWKYVVPPDDYIKTIFNLAKKYFKNNELVLNEAVRASFSEFHGRFGAYYLNIKDLLSQGVQIDRIGLQCHIFDTPLFRNVFDASRFYNILDIYSDFKKPLVLSETSIPSMFSGVLDEEYQAAVANMLYTVCFSHKYMSGVFWWNLTDDGVMVTRRKALGENMATQGLIDREYREKAAYKELDRLINREWRTDVTLTTDQDGKITFNGFNGEYEAIFGDETLSVHLSGETGETQKTIVKRK